MYFSLLASSWYTGRHSNNHPPIYTTAKVQEWSEQFLVRGLRGASTAQARHHHCSQKAAHIQAKHVVHLSHTDCTFYMRCGAVYRCKNHKTSRSNTALLMGSGHCCCIPTIWGLGYWRSTITCDSRSGSKHIPTVCTHPIRPACITAPTPSSQHAPMTAPPPANAQAHCKCAWMPHLRTHNTARR